VERLTSFQERVESRVRALFSDAGLAVQTREVLTAEVPFYSKRSEVAVKIVANGVEVWVYDDEASFSVRGTARVYEKPDYHDSDALTDAFMAELGEAIASR
jgi:hypothetical protein